MSYEILKNENSEITVKVTVDKADFEKAVNTAYNKNKSKFNIPGFRKGKAPRNIIERQYGEGVFFEDAVNALLPVHYDKAIEALELEPVSRPDIDITDIAKGEELVFTATFAVKPEFVLENYKGVEVEKVDAEVTDEMVEEEINKTRDMNARLVSVTDRAVEDGDTVFIDYKGFDGDNQFEGGTAENQELVIGSGQFIPGFEEQLIGKNAGEEVTVEVTFPEEYQAPELAGKAVKFEVKINDIKAKELPELDDEFAKDVSEFDSLEAYKANIKETLEESTKKNAEAAQRDKVIEAVTKLIPVEIPAKMVDAEIDSMLNEFNQQLSSQGLSLDQYIQFTGGSMDDFRGQVRGDAEARVKTGLTIEQVVAQENFEISEEEINAEIAKIAEMQGTPEEEIRKMFERDDFEYLKSNLKSRKAVDFLVEHATLV